MIRVSVENEVRVFSHVIKTDLGVDHFPIGEVRHEPSAYISACGDLLIVNRPVRLLRVDWVVQLFR